MIVVYHPSTCGLSFPSYEVDSNRSDGDVFKKKISILISLLSDLMFMNKTLNIHQHPPIAKVVVGNKYPYVEETQVTPWSLILPIS